MCLILCRLTPLTELVVMLFMCVFWSTLWFQSERASTIRNAILNIQVTLVLVRLISLLGNDSCVIQRSSDSLWVRLGEWVKTSYWAVDMQANTESFVGFLVSLRQIGLRPCVGRPATRATRGEMEAAVINERASMLMIRDWRNDGITLREISVWWTT